MTFNRRGERALPFVLPIRAEVVRLGERADGVTPHGIVVSELRRPEEADGPDPEARARWAVSTSAPLSPVYDESHAPAEPEPDGEPFA